MMNIQTCLNMLRTMKDVAFATVDENGIPQVRIVRDCFAAGNHLITKKGFEITDQCIHCGLCYENCPVQAIRKRGDHQ